MRKNPKNPISENLREVTGKRKTSKILDECNSHLEIVSLSGVIVISRQYLLLRTDFSQKNVVGCP